MTNTKQVEASFIFYLFNIVYTLLTRASSVIVY